MIGRRAVAAVIDSAIILVLLVVIAKLLGNEEASDYSLWAETAGAPRTLFFILAFAYFFGTELAWAQTIGKRVMKLRVVRVDGSKPAAGPTAIRNLVRVVDWLPLLYVVGAISVFATGSRRQRLGDIAAGTKVVSADAAPPPPPPPDDEDVLAQVLR